MKNLTKKRFAGIELVMLFVGVFAFAFILYSSAPVAAVPQSAPSSNPGYCCEKTVEGQWCQQEEFSLSCSESYLKDPTSCQSTSYCRTGTCYNQAKGDCSTTSRNLCEEEEGSWYDKDMEEVPQCSTGCCIFSNQAEFLTNAECLTIARDTGLSVDFREDITDRNSCIAQAHNQKRGACVYENENSKTCKISTKDDCDGDNKFYEGALCSDPDLATNCARQAKTNCYEGKVYWFDSCENRENLYSSDKSKSFSGGRIAKNSDVCSPVSPEGDVNCGNCNIILGTQCSEVDRNAEAKPDYGDYYCGASHCIDEEDNRRENGEEWCVVDSQIDTIGVAKDAVGGEHYKFRCDDGEIKSDRCGPGRSNICQEGYMEGNIGNENVIFSTAACLVNRWQDCSFVEDKDDCGNTEKRDCFWIDERVEGVFVNEVFENIPEGHCVPEHPPSLNFWSSGEEGVETDAMEMCSRANIQGEVVYERGIKEGGKWLKKFNKWSPVKIPGGITFDWDIKKGGEFLSEDWADSANNICVSVGDCGGYWNYEGYYSNEGINWEEDGNPLADGDGKFKEVDYKDIRPSIVYGIIENFGLPIIEYVLFMPVVSGQNPLTEIAGIGGAVSQLVELIGAGGGLFGRPVADAATWAGVSWGIGLAVEKWGGAAPGYANTLAWDSLKVDAYRFGTDKILDLAGYNEIRDAVFDEGLQGTAEQDLKEIATDEVREKYGNELEELSTSRVKKEIEERAKELANKRLKNVLKDRVKIVLGDKLGDMLSTLDFLGNDFLGSPWLKVWNAAVSYSQEKKTVVKFDCLPWQTKIGQNNCKLCNEGDLKCSEYRCHSLGASCEFIDQDEESFCIYVDQRGTNPPQIRPNEGVLTEGYNYSNVNPNPPAPGFKIEKEEGGCLNPYKSIVYGISTDVPAICKIATERTESFEDMPNKYVSGSNFYRQNHTGVLVPLSVPSEEDLEELGIAVDDEVTYYIRCADKGGQSNSVEYAMQVCIDPTPDRQAPIIHDELTRIAGGSSVAEGVSEADIAFFINEPAECKWSFSDRDYDVMENEMSCPDPIQFDPVLGFKCIARLSGISASGTDYYVRCKDNPDLNEGDMNVMAESYEYSLKQSNALKMKNLQPNGTIFGTVESYPITLSAETFVGEEKGKAICQYKLSSESIFRNFDETDGIIHSQVLQPGSGDYAYDVKCYDIAGNVVTGVIDFELEIDTDSPIVARAYEEGKKLKIVTVNEASCSYSFSDCDFEFDDGISMASSNGGESHLADWKQDKTYYVKCADDFRGTPSDCSIIVRPSSV